MASDFKIARIMGIPIRVHLSLLVFFPLIAMQFTFGMGAVTWWFATLLTLLLFFSVALHELGHSLVALAMNVRVREILLLPIGGSARIENMPRRPWQEFLLAAAGPLVSLGLAAGGWTLAGVIYRNLHYVALSRLLATTALINFWLALFNLIPSFPMDGGRIFRALMTPWLGRLRATRVAVALGQGLAIFFGILGAYPPFNWSLVAIAIFVYVTAGAEYRQAQREEAEIQAANREAALRENMALVGPSPYDRTSDQTMVALQTIRKRWSLPGEDDA